MERLITDKWLEKHYACVDGAKWARKQKNRDIVHLCKLALKVKGETLDWVNWGIVRCMEYKQYVAYAVFAAEQVLPIFEKKYPDDKHPRQAIEAARKCIESDTPENRAAAGVAWVVAGEAWAAAGEAWDAAWAAAGEAWVAARAAAGAAAREAAGAAWVATDAVAWAAGEEAWAAGEAREAMKIKILKYGIKLLEVSDESI